MSILSSLRGESVTRGATQDEPRNRSDFKKTFLLRKAGDIVQPVALAKSLLPHGVSLRKAHEVVNRLTADEVPRIGIPVSLRGVADIGKLISELAALSVEAIPLQSLEETGAVLPRLRDQLRLTQDEFALLLDVELGTLRNWEQRRTTVSGGPLGIIVNLLTRNPELMLLGRTEVTKTAAENDRQIGIAQPLL